ncbi:MAG: glycosyltransferase [Anaerolineae bacterium]|nr:glycosyltransferase [Anaerolineae bacterium]
MTPLRVYMIGAFDPDYPRHQIIRAGLERVGVEVVSAILPRHQPTLRLMPQVFRRWRDARQCEVILVPAFNQLLAPFVYLLGVLVHRPVVVDYMVGLTDAAIEERDLPASRKAAIYWLVDWFNVQRMTSLTDTAAHRVVLARLLTSPFRAARRPVPPRYAVERGGGVRPTHMHVLPVGVYDNWFYPQPLPTNDPLLVQFFGSYIPFHGVDVILEAAACLRDNPHVRFELIGRGQTYLATRQRAESMRLTNVAFVDPIPPRELPARVAQADICLGVFGARAKTDYVVPNKVFQCMAVGRPVITAESAALHEYFTPGQDVITIPAGNTAALVAAIEKLVQSPDERTRLGTAAAARIRRAYLPQHIGARLKVILTQPDRPV